jgi:hypothetical protein
MAKLGAGRCLVCAIVSDGARPHAMVTHLPRHQAKLPVCVHSWRCCAMMCCALVFFGGAQVKGIHPNLELCAAVAASAKFAAGATTTGFLADFPFTPHAVEVLAPGMNTTVQVSKAGGSR